MAENLGADGTMIIPPFIQPQQSGNYKTFRAGYQNSSKPIMLYNNPATTNIDLTPDLVAEPHLKNIDFIKESTMDVTRVEISWNTVRIEC